MGEADLIGRTANIRPQGPNRCRAESGSTNK